MSDIVMSNVEEVANPALRSIAQRVTRIAELAILKVAAHHAEPGRFPLPADAASIEGIVAERFKRLPATAQQRAGARAMEFLSARPAGGRVRYPELSRINLANSVSVQVQARELPPLAMLKLAPEQLRVLLEEPYLEDSHGLVPQQSLNKVELRIHKVRCIEETDGGGDDEISLGGTTVNAVGTTKKVAPFEVRDDFDSGEQKVYSPPKRFASFSLLEGNTYPKNYVVTVVMSEVDNGGFPEFLDKLTNWIKDKVADLLGKIIGAIGTIVGLAIGWIVGLLKSLWEDEIFPPRTALLVVKSANGRFAGGKTESPKFVLAFKDFGGNYAVTCDWRLYA